MLLPLVCALLYLLLSVRILVDVKANVDGTRFHASVTFRAWGISVCLDVSGAPQVDGRTAIQSAGRIRRAADLILAALRTIRWGQLMIRVRIGLADAAAAALAAGAANACIFGLLACSGMQRVSDVRIEPDFQGRHVVGHVRCIFSVIPGDIILAVAKEAVKKTQREGLKWLSIPLRA